MREAPSRVLAKVPHLPETPGVYLWKDADGKVLYVGKAKRLRSRVRSYVTGDHRESVKTRALMQQVGALDVVKRLFTVRSCNFDMPKQMPERPCLDYHIGRCKAPCILAQTEGEYA